MHTPFKYFLMYILNLCSRDSIKQILLFEHTPMHFTLGKQLKHVYPHLFIYYTQPSPDMPIYQGLHIPVFQPVCSLPFLWLCPSHQHPPGLDIFGYHSTLICMWLTPVSAHPCPAQRRSCRPGGGGGGAGALQGSAQPEVQGFGGEIPQICPSI